VTEGPGPVPHLPPSPPPSPSAEGTEPSKAADASAVDGPAADAAPATHVISEKDVRCASQEVRCASRNGEPSQAHSVSQAHGRHLSSIFSRLGGSRFGKSSRWASVASATSVGIGQGCRGQSGSEARPASAAKPAVPRFVAGRSGVTPGYLLPVARELSFKYEAEDPPEEQTAESDRFYAYMLLAVWEETIEAQEQHAFWKREEPAPLPRAGIRAGKIGLTGVIAAIRLGIGGQDGGPGK